MLKKYQIYDISIIINNNTRYIIFLSLNEIKKLMLSLILKALWTLIKVYNKNKTLWMQNPLTPNMI